MHPEMFAGFIMCFIFLDKLLCTLSAFIFISHFRLFVSGTKAKKPGFNRISDLADSNDISLFHIKQIGRKTHLLLVTRSSLISSFNHAHVFMNKYTLFAETQINDCYYKKLREQEEK